MFSNGSTMAAGRWWGPACVVWLAVVSSIWDAAAAQATKELACEATDHCSLGKVQPWTGDITPSAGLRGMLSARSYRRELVLVVSNAAFMAVNLQPYLHMKRLGMAHLALMGGNEEQCKMIAAKLPEVGCAWNSVPDGGAPPDLGDIGLLWWMRYRTVLRAARLGYNVYSMDGDSVIFDNFYRIVDAPWAKNITWWNQIEGGWGINGGQVYLRNAAPNGPTVHTMWLVLNVVLRFNDDDYAYAKSRDMRRTCMYVDQDALNAVMESQWVGDGLLTLCAANVCIPQEKQQQKCPEKPQNWQKVTKVQLDPYLQGLADTPEWNFTTRPLRVLHTKGWPGGRWWPSNKGKYSQYLLKLLAEDCPSCPPLLDPEDPSTQAVAAAAPLEDLAVMPPWFTEGWMARGRRGYWTPSILAGQPVKQAVGHIWTMHAAPDHQAAKMYAMQTLGAFDFDFVRTTMGKEPYPACYESGNPIVRGTSPDIASCEGLKLLAWHPEVRLQDTGSPYELALVMRGMAQLATLLGRTLVWPDLPCNATRYISKRPLVKPGEMYTYNSSSPPLDIWSLWYPHGDFRCSWTMPFAEGCLNHRRGMQVWEAADWMKRLPGGSVVAPTKGVNIIGAVEGAAAAQEGGKVQPGQEQEEQEVQEEQEEHEDEQQDVAGAVSADEGTGNSSSSSSSSSRGRLVIANVTLSFQVAGDNATVQELLLGMNDLITTRQRRHRRSRNKRSRRGSSATTKATSSSSSDERPPPSRRLAAVPQHPAGGLEQHISAWPRKLLQRYLASGSEKAFDATLSPFIKTTIEVTADQVSNFVSQHPDLMRQPVLYLATPVRVKELQADGKAAKNEVDKARLQYQEFLQHCDALSDKELVGKSTFEYGDMAASVEGLIAEGKQLATTPGMVVAK